MVNFLASEEESVASQCLQKHFQLQGGIFDVLLHMLEISSGHAMLQC